MTSVNSPNGTYTVTLLKAGEHTGELMVLILSRLNLYGLPADNVTEDSLYHPPSVIATNITKEQADRFQRIIESQGGQARVEATQ